MDSDKEQFLVASKLSESTSAVVVHSDKEQFLVASKFKDTFSLFCAYDLLYTFYIICQYLFL